MFILPPNDADRTLRLVALVWFIRAGLPGPTCPGAAHARVSEAPESVSALPRIKLGARLPLLCEQRGAGTKATRFRLQATVP